MGRGETEVTSEALIGAVNEAYCWLRAVTGTLARAACPLAGYLRRIRPDNDEATLETNNERTTHLCLNGLLEHRHARREVNRLRLTIPLVVEGRLG
ncbi:MAG: hypothetical protein AVDCRST_MAG28-16 [uncultured Rubrobacteraceae bacterium]|uniref:Uncharacterized protein n=1 Tax=uncultured Rubrobacteraceae bacterium TaxID=349277 RepID=A0A6J4Q8P1_9ACTN|nr:MAG: hypothetical protein AVDCRST_MAG28-16 [uncultured Rubrobacteraceae bacterium]